MVLKMQWQIIQCILYQNFHNHYKKFYFHQYFHYILQLIYQLTFFYTYKFYSLNISMASHNLSHSQSQLLGFKINPLSHIPLSINSLHQHLHLSLFQCYLLLQTLSFNIHFHLQVSCHSVSCFITVLDIRLNTLTFMFLTTSGTHNFAFESLILLQLPLHLLILTL